MGPFYSRLASFFKANTEILQRLAGEMYKRSLSPGDRADALIEATGDVKLSTQPVSDVTSVGSALFS